MNNDVRTSPVPADALMRRSRDLLRTVAALTGEPDLNTANALRDPTTTLGHAEQALIRGLADCEVSSARAELAAALSQAGELLAMLREARVVARTTAMDELQQCLARLRSANAVADLVEQVPVEINRLGYRRALFSRLTGPDWRPSSAFAYADPQLAHDLVEVGTAVPGQLGRELPETEVVRTRAPVLVEDAQHNPRVHHRLINLARTRDYVVAPLISRGEVIGFVHADQHVDSDHVSAFDRQLLGLFAEGLGCTLERIVFAEQLARLRNQLTEQARVTDELLEGIGGFAPTSEASPAADPLEQLDGPLSNLTRRELDVLRHVVRGRTNNQIAADLFVSPGTVKTHVKNLLRKLGAANRSEAAARYHTLTS
ncbi:LuxR C-terminal-related transcriptional regulator [Saccharopolyspora endophytica]|uniref:LuxR C-terminal-related transcriptional regulator n=1 Tax=Saccharopolyspora endophytica TaxID=543886 RepID=UPI001FEB55EE|nr:LuxR C-terminal-related transcriptional regulator [Saccharopolyspora endophytica]